LGAALVRFRIQEAAEQLGCGMEPRSVLSDDDETETALSLASVIADSAFAQQTTPTSKASYPVHATQTGSCLSVLLP
jgi:hypothetical protein